MKLVKKVFKYLGIALMLPIIYIVLGSILSLITVNKPSDNRIPSKTIYLHTNGVHLDIIIPKQHISSELLEGVILFKNENYIAFGWGEENFYINTPTWSDLTFKNAFGALFLENNTLLHLRRYKQKRKSWIKIPITEKELERLNQSILATFKTDSKNKKILIPDAKYNEYDNFYEAHGNYSLLKTCNTWVNKTFKQAGLKACLWTPFDFGLLNKYPKKLD